MNSLNGKTVIDPASMDSDEERHFYAWLIEAERSGLVSNIEYHSGSFVLADRATIPVEKQLKTKTKIVEKFLLHPHRYTPDFVFVWHGLFNPFTTFQNTTWVDVKGTGSKYHDQKSFSINRKWVYEKFGIYINQVVPEKLFKKTFLPESCRLTKKTRKPVKKFIGCKTIYEYAGIK